LIVTLGAATSFALLATPAQAALDITVPATASLGSRAVGSAGTLTAVLGTVTVTTTLPNLAWTATVSATDCTTGGGASYQTIAKSRLRYWSGPVFTSTSINIATPGQLASGNQVTLTSPRTAFSAVVVPLTASSLAWRPTLIVNVPATVVAGLYTCVVTHSVA
jgi:hypothetical protein